MSHPSVSETLFERSTLQKTCRYCGAQLEVRLARAPDGNEPFEYECPECGKEYEVEAALQPEVQLVAPRTDGKTDRYQETMF